MGIRVSVFLVVVICVMFIGCVEDGADDSFTPTPSVSENDSDRGFIDLNTTRTKPEIPGEVVIENVGEFDYDPSEVETVREDIFREGYFSVFDVLVYLSSKGDIELDYHFDESMNTHVIDSINGKEDWWYYAHYEGGWKEKNVFRMDHYPVKDKTYIHLYQESPERIEDIYKAYREEIERKEQNDGKVIIPEVLIKTPTEDLLFRDVEVEAHNFRNDFFQPEVITALDVIASLANQDKISYEVKWYESIGTVTVKNYYVEKINDDEASGRCGFVYEAGSNDLRGFKGNHIHVQSDIRVINSPEYEKWFWICT